MPTSPLGSWACLKPQLPWPSASGDEDGHVSPPGVGGAQSRPEAPCCPRPGSRLTGPLCTPQARKAIGTKPTPPTSVTRQPVRTGGREAERSHPDLRFEVPGAHVTWEQRHRPSQGSTSLTTRPTKGGPPCGPSGSSSPVSGPQVLLRGRCRPPQTSPQGGRSLGSGLASSRHVCSGEKPCPAQAARQVVPAPQGPQAGEAASPTLGLP